MMFSTQGAIASRNLDFLFSDELVVVGRVPMSRKGGQRQLKRIARANEPSQEPPKDQRSDSRRNTRPEKPRQAPKPQEKPRQAPKPQEPKPRQAPKPQEPKPRQAPKPQEPKPRQAPKEPAQELRAVVVAPPVAAAALAELPAETLACVARWSGLGAVGALAATGRAVHASCWGPQSLHFWQGLGSVLAAPAPWDAFRRARFQLGPGCVGELERLARDDPLAGLARCCAVAKALLRTDTTQAAVLAALSSAALGCAPAPALELLDATLPKLRQEVFPVLTWAVAARDQLCEQRILDELDAQREEEQQAMTFDYFAEPEQTLGDAGAFWDELENLQVLPTADEKCDDFALEAEPEAAPAIEDATSRLLAAEFLEAMGLHHGFAWQEAATAIEAR